MVLCFPPSAGAARLRLLLSFAVGGLLGDVFLHLLPEAWKHVSQGRCYPFLKARSHIETELNYPVLRP